MIRFRCENCGKTFQVEDQAAGKRARCGSCGTEIGVPKPMPPPVPADAATKQAGVELHTPVRPTAEPPPFKDNLKTKARRAAGAGAISGEPGTEQVPDYNGVLLLVGIHMVIGTIACVIGVLWFLVVVGIKLPEGGSIGETLPCIGLFLAGLVTLGVGQVFICIRDIARNSFK